MKDTTAVAIALGELTNYLRADDGCCQACGSDRDSETHGALCPLRILAARLRNSEEPVAFDARWKIERDSEDGLIWITHSHCSLTGQGKDLAEAARDLLTDMPDVFAAYAGRDTLYLSEHAAEMVEWLKAVGGFAAPEDTEAEG